MAVAESRLLREEAVRRGAAWLGRRVSVSVHITQQADPAFFSKGMLPFIGLSDNALHDHRKIAFYDLTEADPYRGAAIVAGMGVGERYSGLAWDDRAAILRGTAAHSMKRHALRVLSTNGLMQSASPEWLRVSNDTIPAADLTASPRFDDNAVTAMLVHNDVGYGEKQATLAKAVLYSLMPQGAVVKVANGLWLNPLWGSMLLGHAMRGGRVMIVTASLENSVFGKAEMSLVSEVLAQLIRARTALAGVIGRSEGLLATGIYDVDISVDDIPSRIDTALARRAKAPWLQKLEPFSKEVIDSLKAVSKSLRARTGQGNAPRTAPVRSKLHIKAQFVASAEAWDNLFVQRGWGAALATYFRSLDRIAQQRPQYAEFHKVDPSTVTYIGGTLSLRQELASAQSDRALYYVAVGSFNEDYRSALLDGETLLIISKFGAAVAVPDFVLLPSLCTWVESVEELHRYLPARATWLTRALRFLY